MTAWPLIWTIQPSNPNVEREIGQSLNFTVSAIPDPEFPNSWDSGADPMNPNPLPPQPTNIELVVVNENINDESLYTIEDDTATVNVNDVRIFLPFQSIKFEKDGEIYQVQYEQDMNEIGYDFVFEFIPHPAPFETRFITLRATSTADNDLNGTFNFRVNNNFDAVRSALRGITATSSDFLSSLESGDGSAPEYDNSTPNEKTVFIPEFGGSYVEPNYDELFPSDENKKVDGIIRNGDASEIEQTIGNGSSLTKTPKPSNNAPSTLGTTNPNDDDLDNWFENLGK